MKSSIASKLKLALICRSSDRGFTLPLVLGFGLMMLLVGAAMLVKSQGEQVNNLTQLTRTRSQGVAEAGINRYYSFVQNNKTIATYPDCAATRNSGGACPDTSSTASWSNAGSIPGVSGTSVIASIANAAQTSWQNIDPNDASKGQYRLISYSYVAGDPSQPNQAPGKGILTVEGRVNQQGSGASATESVGTGTTRLRVSFPVTSTASTFPGGLLWISCNADSSISNSTSYIQSNVKDSTPATFVSDPPCQAASSSTKIQDLKDQQPANTPPFTYQTSSDPFPPLPTEGQLANVPTTGVCTIATTIQNATTIPAACPSGGGTYNTYHLTNSSSINFTGDGDILTVNAPGQTVKLYLNGTLTVTHSGAGIVVTPGTTLIIYAHDAITLNGGSSIGGPLSNTGTPDKIQIYQWPADRLRLTGGSGASAFIFAPFAQVSMTGASAITGAIWAYSYSATGGSDFISRSDTNCANLASGICNSGSSNQIGTINVWTTISR